MNVLILGGDGFVGRHLQKELARDPAISVTAPESGKLDIRDREALSRAASGMDVIYNLVGIIKGSDKQFYDLHVGGTKNVVYAARAERVKKIVYISALGVADPRAQMIPYFATKAEAERVIIASGISHTILRPSAMFGPGAGFLKPFVRIIRWSPILLLPGMGKYRFQLVAVDTTARILARAAAGGEGTYVVSGPEVLTLREIFSRLLRYLGKKRVTIPVPFAIPVPGIITRSQLAMLRLENFGESGKTKETFDYPDIYFDPKGAYPLL